MAKYIKRFNDHSEYTAYTADTGNFILPNVSYCINQDEMHYNPYVEPISIIAIYNVSWTNNATRIASAITADTKEIWVDGVKQDAVSTGYTFSTVGEHEVKFVLKDDITSIGNSSFYKCIKLSGITIPNDFDSVGTRAFQYCSGLTNIEIPNSVTSIGQFAFQRCSVLTSVTIPSSVTSIGSYAFSNCSSLSAVTCLPTTPPPLDPNVFINNASGRKIYVPSGSVNAYKTASGWSEYASDIEPIGGVPVN